MPARSAHDAERHERTAHGLLGARVIAALTVAEAHQERSDRPPLACGAELIGDRLDLVGIRRPGETLEQLVGVG